ncbi:arsenate reductase-like glutaredoxin family protein [Rhodovulum imhoffii]|uniref:Arsenate reductase-like glutaredoxin family protein n=1 Tax=Rhodovulum imhoffii TaxID=365340 RepID=A0A2T5BW91_9RHOB|nr:ArsC/Spx/MgsR family protein [Rhodovulum imhoffii]MBK5935129.1 arsenate reductase [Rhodovulum imhoffii]PTN03904.1 arsenate reductase-like glutaredoxin family protein [Rhodovulum imhoffii]
MRFFGLKSCDTCRKARKSLSPHYQMRIIDVRDDGVSRGDLARFYQVFGDRLVNRRSTTWREIDEAMRSSNPVDLLAACPTLMKRPVIEHRGLVYLGWGQDVQAALLDRIQASK